MFPYCKCCGRPPSMRTTGGAAGPHGTNLALGPGAVGSCGHPDAPGAAVTVLMEELHHAREEVQRAREELGRSWDQGPRSAEQVVRHVVIPTLDLLEEAATTAPEDFGAALRDCAALAQSGGLERLYPLGELVDPVEHQVVGPPPGAGSRTVEVLRPGYRFGGRLLRPAAVRAAPR